MADEMRLILGRRREKGNSSAIVISIQTTVVGNQGCGQANQLGVDSHRLYKEVEHSPRHALFLLHHPSTPRSLTPNNLYTPISRFLNSPILLQNAVHSDRSRRRLRHCYFCESHLQQRSPLRCLPFWPLLQPAMLRYRRPGRC